jgi:hypothetical protein
MKLNKGFMKRGYKSLDSQMENRGRFIACCDSCTFFYTRDSSPESCKNGGVTKFDMVITAEGRTYCTYWKSVGTKEK